MDVCLAKLVKMREPYNLPGPGSNLELNKTYIIIVLYFVFVSLVLL